MLTKEEANRKEQAILSSVLRHGYYPQAGQFHLEGGALRVEPHPELPTSWRLVWQPADTRLQALDLSEFNDDAAAEQIGRHKLSTYPVIRQRFEAQVKALEDEGISPSFTEKTSPDTFQAGGITLAIHARKNAQHEHEYFIEMADTIPVEVADGEETPECQWVEVTNCDPKELVERCKSFAK